MFTTVKFLGEKYGNYLDNYYTDNYEAFITTLQEKTKFTQRVNLGVADGIIVENNFEGDFQDINCAIVESSTYGTHLYKIIKKVFIRRNLWRITMVKDIVSARYSDIINSKVLVSRLGLNRREFNPLLFIEEPIDLSEIKKEQILINQLKGTKSWGYLAIWKRDSLDGTNIKWDAVAREDRKYDIRLNTLDELDNYGSKEFIKTERWAEDIIYFTDTEEIYVPTISTKGKITTYKNHDLTGQIDPSISECKTVKSVFNLSKYFERRYNKMKNISSVGETVGNIYKNLGKTIYEISTGKYYKVELQDTIEYMRHDLSLQDMKDIIGSEEVELGNNTPVTEIRDFYKIPKYTQLNEPVTMSKTLSPYENTIDQPLQMFFIPVIEDGFINYDNEYYITDRTIIENLLYDLISDYSGENGKLVDVQIIPYAPIEGYDTMWDEVSKVLDIEDNAKDVITIPNTDLIIPIFQVDFTSFSFTIEQKMEVDDYKINQKYKYILTSPSGASPYEFSVGKNKGLEGFIINVDLRPFASFHQIQPIFKGLYGNNFKDTRGLIWQEDMSLTLISDNWETYKRQNINFVNSFIAEQNYKISELGITHEANFGNYGYDAGKRMIEATIEGATFLADSISKDAWFGAKGGAAGAAGAAAIIGGTALAELLEFNQLAYNNKMDKKLLANSISHSREQFAYNIGNIKALPENISKVSGIFKTNNYVPYLQVFAPSDEEIEYFNNYLDTYGINVGQMVDLKDLEFDLLQGTIVKFSSVITQEEYEEISDALGKGIRRYE